MSWSLALLLGAPLAGAPGAAAEIVVVELDGVIHAVSAEHVVHSMDAADATGAPLLILRLDTPGGLDTAMRQIVDRMLGARTPVAVFVGPAGARAASAGFVITIAADVAAMAPGTNLGAAHPVAGIGQLDEVTSRKLTQDAAAYTRSKAQRRGRNPELAELAVTESRSFTETEALENGLIDLVAADVDALIAALEGREVTRFDGSTVRLSLADRPVRTMEMSWRQQLLAAIARPEVLFLLLLGAFAGIGAELSHPGLVLPGVVGVLCLILFLFASQIIPINWAGLLLILLGLALFAAEVKVTSYGLLTVGGIVAMGLGAMMLVESPLPEARISPWTIWPAVGAMALWTTLLLRLAVHAHRRRPTTGAAGMVSARGVARTPLAAGGEGWVEVAGERWRAEADEAVAEGDRIQVIAVDGLTLRVRKGES
jgi:membrane-bound serine protease (ClpP class)